MLNRFGLACAAVALATAAQAQELSPIEACTVVLGPVTGVAYYTVQPDGYRVVATLGSEGAAPPVRFTATLMPGQAVTISVPQEVGAPIVEVMLARRGDRVVVSDNAPAIN